MPIPLLLQAYVQILEVSLQVPPVLFLRDAIHPYRRVRPRAALRSFQGWHIDQLCQCVESSCGLALRSFHYLPKSW